MQRLLLFISFIVGVSTCFAQESKYMDENTSIPSPQARLKVDFEVKNQISVPDSLLYRIDWKTIELQRQSSQRVEYFDIQSGLTLIIYSKTEAIENKKTSNESDKSMDTKH